jgi:hypothetical protein
VVEMEVERKRLINRPRPVQILDGDGPKKGTHRLSAGPNCLDQITCRVVALVSMRKSLAEFQITIL